jgi:hypothetical protein
MIWGTQPIGCYEPFTGEEIGTEVHDLAQVISFESGRGKVILCGKE